MEFNSIIATEDQIDLFTNPISGGLTECGAEIELIRPEAGGEKLHGQGGAVRLLIRSRGTLWRRAERVLGACEESRGGRAAF